MECKDVEYASIHHLFDELLPLNFLHYHVIVRSGNFSNIQDSMKRLCLMFIPMDRHHYNKAALSWISDTQHQRDICPEYYQAKQDLCCSHRKKSRNISLKDQKLYKQDRQGPENTGNCTTACQIQFWKQHV